MTWASSEKCPARIALSRMIARPAAFVGISHLLSAKEVRARFPQLARYGLMVNSDAYRLNEIRRRTTFKLAHRSVAELALA